MKITAVETIQLEPYPFLIVVRVHTDEGLIGVSDTFYTGDAVRGFVHETAASYLLGKDPRDIERHWDALYARTVARWGGVGTELRAISCSTQHSGHPRPVARRADLSAPGRPRA